VLIEAGKDYITLHLSVKAARHPRVLAWELRIKMLLAFTTTKGPPCPIYIFVVAMREIASAILI